jgi:hypothetical protein
MNNYTKTGLFQLILCRINSVKKRSVEEWGIWGFLTSTKYLFCGIH